MPDKARVERFLRTLLGLLTVGWVVVAVVNPESVWVFFVRLVVAWVAALAVAAWLELGDGYRRLRASRLYAPAVRASTATGAFVLLALALKLLFVLAANLLLGRAAVGDAEGVVAGVLALAVAYAVVFLIGGVALVRPSAATSEG